MNASFRNIGVAKSSSIPWRQRVWGVLRLLRPLNVVFFVIGVMLGGVLSAGSEAVQEANLVRLLVAAGSAACIGGAANSLNDIFDLEIDRVNRPDRPLPAGLVAPRTAWIVWIVGSVLGVGLSLGLSGVHVGLAVGAVVLLYAYNAFLKHVPGVGNLVVALVVALVVVYGGMAVGPVGPALVGAAFAFLIILAREIVKDVQDMAGDAEGGGRTLPLVAGPRTACRSAAGLVALTMVFTPAPFLWGSYEGLYLLAVLFADMLLMHVVGVLVAPPTAARAARASRLLKGAMGLGMVALIVAGLGGG